ncbi:MAG: hypothetical protein AB1403_11295 [Candidatus Riflebacteria bacterium]
MNKLKTNLITIVMIFAAIALTAFSQTYTLPDLSPKDVAEWVQAGGFIATGAGDPTEISGIATGALYLDTTDADTPKLWRFNGAAWAQMSGADPESLLNHIASSTDPHGAIMKISEEIGIGDPDLAPWATIDAPEEGLCRIATNALIIGTLEAASGTIEAHGKYHRTASYTLASADTWTDAQFDGELAVNTGFAIISSTTIQVEKAGYVQVNGSMRPKWTGASNTQAYAAARILISTNSGSSWTELRCSQAILHRSAAENETNLSTFAGSFTATAGALVKLQLRVSDVAMVFEGATIFDNPAAFALNLFTSGI